MNLTELSSEVLAIVKRPDLSDRIVGAVKAATLKAHRRDYFYKDLVESGISFSTPNHIQNFQPSQNFERFRKVKYVRYWWYDPCDVPNFGKPGEFLTAIDIENSIDLYGYIKEDVFYMAGDVLQIRARKPLTHCLVGVYTLPDITTETFSSWVADEYPNAIIFEAARQILMSIGKNQDASNCQNLRDEEYQLMSMEAVNKPGE